jgi:hypothetical protein
LLRYDNLAAVVHDREYLEFLDEVLPERIAAEDAAAINLHLKLNHGVIVNPQKKVRLHHPCDFCFVALVVNNRMLTGLQARVDNC